jgi:hypothetical protein
MTQFPFGIQPVVNIVAVLTRSITVKLECAPRDASIAHTRCDHHCAWRFH